MPAKNSHGESKVGSDAILVDDTKPYPSPMLSQSPDQMLSDRSNEKKKAAGSSPEKLSNHTPQKESGENKATGVSVVYIKLAD